MTAQQYDLSRVRQWNLGQVIAGDSGDLVQNLIADVDTEYGYFLTYHATDKTKFIVGNSSSLGVLVSGINDSLDDTGSATNSGIKGVKANSKGVIKNGGVVVVRIDKANKPEVGDTAYVSATGVLTSDSTANKLFNGRVLSVETKSPEETAIVEMKTQATAV